MARQEPSRYEYPSEFAWDKGAQFRSDVVPRVLVGPGCQFVNI
jgi:hypothetical protein